MKTTLTRDMGSDIKNRGVFNQKAKTYARIRPHYPEALFDKLVKQTALSSDAKLLEIGPGTGQATISMAKRGYNIVGIELGSKLAKIAKQNLRSYPNVKLVLGAFEDTEMKSKSFDLIYSATAFHWIEPSIRYKKTHRILKPGGYLGLIQTNQISDNDGDLFFYASQPIYDKYMPSSGASSSLPRTEDIKPTKDLDTKLFKLVHFECFPLTVTYSAGDYVDLLSTYSPQLALLTDARIAFLKEIKNLINTGFKGSVTKHYTMSLTLAQNT